MNELLDIIFTLIEGCCFLYMVKDEKVKRIRQVFFLIFIIFVFFHLTKVLTLSQIGIKLLFAYGITILSSFFILGLSAKKSVFYMTICEFLLMISEIIIESIALMFQISPGSKEDTSIPVIHIIISKILFITFLIIVQKIIYDINKKRFDIKALFYFISSNIGYVIVAICIYVYILYTEGESYNNVFIICSVTMLIAFVANVLFSNKYVNMENKAHEQRMAIYELEIQTRYYEEKMKEEERIKEVYHDMKNHLLLLEDCGENHSEKIENLRKELMQYENYYRTGNKFVDIILKDKLAKASEHNIQMEDRIELVDVDFIEPLDLSTIFGNLLDNAIEECKFIEEPEKRHIRISAKKEKNFLVIGIKNNKQNKKVDHVSKKVIHGYGLINVRNAIHKYGGEIDINETKYDFDINIIIPLNNKEGDHIKTL